MRKRRLLLCAFLLFLSAVLLTRASSGHTGKALGQGQLESPQFYALQVIFENNVQNAKNSLGAPDGHDAEILPGGQLVVLMENKLYPFLICINWLENIAGLADSGSVVGRAEIDFRLEGWFPIQDTQGKQDYIWRPLGISVSGFWIWLEGSAGVDMIRITNLGNKSLFVDAVIGFGREAERR